MTRYVQAALALAVVSFALAVLVLSGLFGVNPLQLSVVDRLSDAETSTDESAAVQAVTAISVAISTVMALALGSIAVIALIVAEKSETRAIEQLKLDFAALASTLVSIRDRSLLYTNPGLIHLELDPFRPEREALAKILTSPTGWAIQAWSHREGDEEYDELYPDLAGLVDVMTLDLARNRQAILDMLAERSVAILDRIVSIEERDFKQMSAALSRLSEGLSRASTVLRTDKLAEFQRQRTAAEMASYRAPTEEELTKIAELADQRIGGEAGKTLEALGRAAIDGSPEDRRTFHRAITQLLDVELDDVT
jgi:hypothetical protein